MTPPNWIADHWFTLLQSVGIVGGLFFTGVSLRKDAEVRRVQTLISVTHEHRDLWSQLYKEPELWRVLDPKADLRKQPPTVKERKFVSLVILHLQSVHEAMRQGMFVRVPGLRNDIRHFFSLPIVKATWELSKALQDPEFVRFVEDHRDEAS